MRLVRLLGIAIQAEGLRLRYQIRRIIIRLVLCYGILILVFCSATFGHIAGCADRSWRGRSRDSSPFP